MNTPWLMRWRGRPVPWITQWTGERIDPRGHAFAIVNDTLSYAHSDMFDRDSLGVLWGRFTNAPGQGEPLWAQVHIGRQRQAMRQLRCQVCATYLDRCRTPWLLPGQEWAAIADDPAQLFTSTAPCCQRCWPVADKLCPYLRAAPSWRGFLHRPRRWGVVGDIYLPDATLRHATVRDGSPNTRVTLAKQLVVTWEQAEAG